MSRCQPVSHRYRYKNMRDPRCTAHVYSIVSTMFVQEYVYYMTRVCIGVNNSCTNNTAPNMSYSFFFFLLFLSTAIVKSILEWREYYIGTVCVFIFIKIFFSEHHTCKSIDVFAFRPFLNYTGIYVYYTCV